MLKGINFFVQEKVSAVEADPIQLRMGQQIKQVWVISMHIYTLAVL